MAKEQTALVVDDDEELSQLIKMQLDSIGYKAALAGNTAAARAWLKSHRPAVILLDVMMPDGNGLDFCRWVRAQVRFMEIPILVMSALKDEETVSDALELGANDFLQKPFALKVLKDKIERLRR